MEFKRRSMNNIWHNISSDRITTRKFEAFIEIPKGCKAKYELDKETGALKLDRVLYTSTVYPANYGFIPKTLAEDGDPLDVLVLCGEAIYPATLVQCYPIGVITMIDGGSLDEKIIAIPFGDPTYNNYYDTACWWTWLWINMTFFSGSRPQAMYCASCSRVRRRRSAGVWRTVMVCRSAMK